MNNKVENNMKEEVITDTSSISSEQSQSSISEGHKSSHYSTVGDNPAEAILASVAYILLTIGVVVSVLVGGLFIMGGNEFESKWGSLIGWVILIGGAFLSAIIWAVNMILINISNNVRQIKYILQDKE